MGVWYTQAAGRAGRPAMGGRRLTRRRYWAPTAGYWSDERHARLAVRSGASPHTASAEPSRFFITPLCDGYPALLVRLTAGDLDEVTELVVEAWRICAPKRLVSAYDQDQPPGSSPADRRPTLQERGPRAAGEWIGVGGCRGIGAPQGDGSAGDGSYPRSVNLLAGPGAR